MIVIGSISRRPWLAILVVALSVGIAAPRARAIIINGEGPNTVTGIYDRFNVDSYASAPVANPSFIGAAFDLSGIGWLAGPITFDGGPNHSVTLISSRYIISASHNAPASGTAVEFFGTDHLLHSATVATNYTLTFTNSSGGTFASDITVGRLVTALPPSVTPMPIFYRGTTDISNLASFNQYRGLSLFNYGKTARMGTNVLEEFFEYPFLSSNVNNVFLDYLQGGGAGETLLEGGDSGSPTIAYLDGIYGLIGTHSGVDTPQSLSADAFVAYTPYIDQINAILANDNQTLAFVPEPGTMMLGLAVAAMCGACRLRRVRREI